MQTGYFIVLDVLGFRQMVRNLEGQRLADRIDGWVRLTQESGRECGLENVQLISDTVFASAPDSADGLAQAVRFAKVMLEKGLRDYYPVRGAIVHGDFTWGALIYGSAVIEAHELEMAQDWIGVTCAKGLPNVAAMWGLDSLIAYLPPLKTGTVSVHPVVSWTIPDTTTLTQHAVRGAAVKDGVGITWDQGTKINNTAQLALYKRFLLARKGDPSSFYGWVPVHALESMVPNEGG
jgi:hypothetical protein